MSDTGATAFRTARRSVRGAVERVAIQRHARGSSLTGRLSLSDTEAPSRTMFSGSYHRRDPHLSRHEGGCGIECSGGSAGSATNVDLSPFLIASFPSSRPSLRSFTLPVPLISSNSHEPVQLNERLAVDLPVYVGEKAVHPKPIVVARDRQ